jgi:hypothetical protein
LCPDWKVKNYVCHYFSAKTTNVQYPCRIQTRFLEKFYPGLKFNNQVKNVTKGVCSDNF